jgi:hypothetical protein
VSQVGVDNKAPIREIPALPLKMSKNDPVCLFSSGAAVVNDSQNTTEIVSETLILQNL